MPRATATGSRTTSRRPRPVADGRRRHRQDDAGDAGLEGGARGRPPASRSTRCRGCSAGSAAPTTPRPARRPTSTFFERLTSVDLLHLDDLGAEKRTDWVLEQLYAIVDARYEEQRSMVVTTNLDQPALEEQIGARTVSRLVEICGDPLPLFGDDQRYRVARRRPARRSDTGCPSLIIPRHAGNGDRRRPVGRRGKGKGDRPARRAGRPRRALSGRQQRRPHDRPRRRGVQAPPGPLGDPLPGEDLRDRQRRRDRPEGPHRRDRGAEAARDRRRQPADLRQRPPDHALPRAARHGGRGEARQALDRHHQARDRPLLRGQVLAARDPRPGPARREDPAQEDHGRDGAEARSCCARTRRTPRSTCTR